MESFGRLGVERSAFIGQLAASAVGGRDGGSMARKEVVGTPFEMVSVTARVAISRRVSRSKLQLKNRQEARKSRGESDRPTSMAWGCSLDAVWDLTDRGACTDK